MLDDRALHGRFAGRPQIAIGADDRHGRERGLQSLVEGRAHPVGTGREHRIVRGVGGHPGGVR